MHQARSTRIRIRCKTSCAGSGADDYGLRIATTSISTNHAEWARPTTWNTDRLGGFGCAVVPHNCVAARHEPGEVHPAAVGRIAHQEDVHLDHVAHRQAQAVECLLDRPQRVHGLRLRVGSVNRGSIGAGRRVEHRRHLARQIDGGHVAAHLDRGRDGERRVRQRMTDQLPRTLRRAEPAIPTTRTAAQIFRIMMEASRLRWRAQRGDLLGGHVVRKRVAEVRADVVDDGGDLGIVERRGECRMFLRPFSTTSTG